MSETSAHVDRLLDDPLVLVVDDDAAMRRVLTDGLLQSGFRVMSVGSGEEAVAAFIACTPEAVILDVFMPGMSGFETCRALRQMPGGEATPIIMLTGSDDVAAVRRAYEAGATDFTAKPISSLVLSQRIRYLLRAKAAVDELRRSEAKLEAAQRIARIGTWEFDLRTQRMTLAPVLEQLFDASNVVRESRGLRSLLRYVHPDDRGDVLRALNAPIHSRGTANLDHRVRLLDGRIAYVHTQAELVRAPDGRMLRLEGTCQDITERKLAEERIRSLAYYDSLTLLPNRLLFITHLEYALGAARRAKRSAALLFLDLDNFKRINDTLGHPAGDKLLIEVAARLKQMVRTVDSVGRGQVFGEGDQVARLGGDEFIVFIAEILRAEDAARIARRILDSFAAPFILGTEDVFVSASIGISHFPDDGTTVDDLLKNADAAMYRAKNTGKNVYCFYDSSMNAAAFQRLSMETNLRRALERNEFRLYFQPQVDAESWKISGAEALIRWQHPDLGLVPPGDFIPLAEESGLILPIGEWVLHAAFEQHRAWRLKGITDVRVAINLSGHQFRQPALLRMLDLLLREAGVDPGTLELEITESVLMESAQESMAILRELKEMHLRLAIDDFGMGFSSLSYLKRLPVDAIKIDRAFIQDTPGSSADAAITTAIIGIARSLGLDTIAEGCEHANQCEFLRANSCTTLQGYLFGKPMPADEFEKLWHAQPWRQPTQRERIGFARENILIR